MNEASLIHQAQPHAQTEQRIENAPGFQKKWRKASSIHLSDSHGFNIKRSYHWNFHRFGDVRGITAASAKTFPSPRGLKLQIPVSCARPWAGHPQSLAIWAILPQILSKWAQLIFSRKRGRVTMACIHVPNIFCSSVGISDPLLLLSQKDAKGLCREIDEGKKSPDLKVKLISLKARKSQKYRWSNFPLLEMF